MRCDEVREALSARLDGEDPGVEDSAVDVHVVRCRGCTAWTEEVSALHRMVRVREAERVPDLSEAILGRSTPPARGIAAGDGDR